jgi:ABC-type antimicrobial peptide transport system ATPase subunit
VLQEGKNTSLLLFLHRFRNLSFKAVQISVLKCGRASSTWKKIHMTFSHSISSQLQCIQKNVLSQNTADAITDRI